MSSDRLIAEIVRHLAVSPVYKFSDSGSYLISGRCPACDKKSLFISKDKPFVLCCNHKNACGYSEPIREAVPELFEDFAKRYPPTEKNRNATADAYLAINRGFDLSKIRGWYEQAAYPIPHSDRFVPAVRFYIDARKTRYWERLIGKGKDGEKAHFGGKRKDDNSLFKGDVWAPPKFTLEKGEECYITEGIFHAIALHHAGIKAVAAFSSNHYPSAFFDQHAKKGVKWVWALDSDNAGKEGMRKHHAMLKAKGEHSCVCLPPPDKDWDDLHREGKITAAFLAEGKYRGNLFTAKTVEEKAYHYYLKNFRSEFLLDFKNSLYSIALDADFAEPFALLVEQARETVLIKKQQIKKDEGESEQEAEKTRQQEEESDYRRIALQMPEGADLFKTKLQIVPISNVRPQFLYMEKNTILDEQYYVFSIDYSNGQSQDIIKLEGTAITTPVSFHNALLNKSRGGTFEGDAKNLRRLRSQWLNHGILTVAAIPYIGYEKELGAYIYPNQAWHNGRRIEPNKQGYITIKRSGIKTSLQGISINTAGGFSSDWLDNFIKAFSWQGLTALAFWLGSLFVQQIRERHKSFPFLELSGEPGTGKSTLMEFLWKLLGRDDYEGFDLLKATNAGRRRAFSQVSNLPVVIIESDRDNGEKDAKQKQFGFDEVKPFFNGRGTGTLGVAKRGNETDESYFQGALVIAQNAEVDGSPALLERIVHCNVDKKHHKPGTREIARWFERQTSESVGGFLHAALSRERQILEAYEQAFQAHEKAFSACNLKNERIIKNHAQVTACASALQLIFPTMTDSLVSSVASYLQERALVRESRLGADHPVLEAFWEAYDYINSRSERFAEILNHSHTPETTIALNLNQFREKCMAMGQAVPDLTLLKKLLPGTKRHKFLESNKQTASRIDTGRGYRCWIFEKKEKP